MERLYEEKELSVDETLSLPVSTYTKDSVELAMINPISLNPLDNNEYGIDQVLKMIYEPVFKLSPTFELEEGIIESYEKLGEKTYRFTIGDNKTFHNDLPVTPEDIEYSYNYIENHPNSTYNYVLGFIDTFTIVDDKRFDVSFKTLNYYNLYSLTYPILCEEYVTSSEYEALKPIGSGGFMYNEFQSMIELSLKKFPAYTKTNIAYEYITINIVREKSDEYNMFQSKRIDIHNPIKTSWTKYSDDQLITRYVYDSPYYYYIGINHRDEKLNKLDYRKLVATTIPYTSIQVDAFLGHLNATTLPIVSSHQFNEAMDSYYVDNNSESYFTNTYSKENKGKYQSLLRESNPMFDIHEESFTLIYNRDDIYQNKIIEVMEQKVSSSYIVYNYVGLDAINYKLAIESGNYDLFIGEIKVGVIPNLMDIYSSTGALNYGGYESLNIDGLLSTYMKVSQEEQFAKQLENLSKVFCDELPLIPLGFLENGMFAHNQLNGYLNPNYFQQFYGIEEIDTIME